MADAADSKSAGGNIVWVQVPPSALNFVKSLDFSRLFLLHRYGKGGTADEAKHYQPLFAESEVMGFDYQSNNPWEAKGEFSSFYDLQSKK